ncbi:MAG: Gfo/Idh/MocA family protein [Chitinophagales bacterium]
MEELGVALVGLGMVAGVHAAALKEIPGARIVGAWSRSAETTAAFASTHAVRSYASYEELLADPGVDVVDICSPAAYHVDLGLRAAAAGKHVIVEKPISTTVEAAQRLIDGCRAAGRGLAVIFQYRFAPDSVKVKAAMEEGLLGAPILGDAYVKWYRSSEYYAAKPWRGTEAVEGGGALMNQAIHTIDLLQWFMGGVASVSGLTRTSTHRIEAEDLGVAVVEFGNGAVGVIEGSTAVVPSYKERIELHGQRGTIVLEGASLKEWKVEGMSEADYVKERVSYGATNSPAISPSNHRAQLEATLAAFRQGVEPPVSGEEGLKALRIVRAIYESAAKGVRIRL